MDKQALEEKKLSVEQQFNSLVAKDQELNQQLATNKDEELKLAGEYRLLSDLITNWPEAQTAAEGETNG